MAMTLDDSTVATWQKKRQKDLDSYTKNLGTFVMHFCFYKDNSI